jgi:hypothetical protein
MLAAAHKGDARRKSTVRNDSSARQYAHPLPCCTPDERGSSPSPNVYTGRRNKRDPGASRQSPLSPYCRRRGTGHHRCRPLVFRDENAVDGSCFRGHQCFFPRFGGCLHLVTQSFLRIYKGDAPSARQRAEPQPRPNLTKTGNFRFCAALTCRVTRATRRSARSQEACHCAVI